MDVNYNKGLEHCIEIEDKSRSIAFKVSEAKLLAEKLSRTIDEAERDRDRDQMTPLEDALDDIIREAISQDYVNLYVGDRMVQIAKWGKRLNAIISKPAKEKLNGVELIAAERQRQIDVEGYDASHDRDHSFVELARAAITYLEIAIFAIDIRLRGDSKAVDKLKEMGMRSWPWGKETLKPSLDSKRDIAKGCSLGAAAIDRIIMDE